MSANANGQDEEESDRLAWLRQPQDMLQAAPQVVPLCWPFPPGSQNRTEKAVPLKPYVPPKRRSLNQY